MSKNNKFKIEKDKDTNIRITVRVTPDMYEEIATTAQNNEVSMNTLITSCIRYALDNKE